MRRTTERPGVMRPIKPRSQLALLAVWGLILTITVACATSPTGRQQLLLFSEAQMRDMGNAAFVQLQQQTPVLAAASQTNSYVDCIMQALVRELPSPGRWEVKVFQGDDTVNAFALPGGHIGVYTGMFKVATTQDQLAAVIGHEIAHVIADHSNARLSTQYATDAGLSLLDRLLNRDSADNRQIMGLLGLGAQVGIILPFSRADETEADILGLQYMAQAGFDPRASIQLWQNMAAQGKGAALEFLSTHPAHGTRITTLQNNMPQAMALYNTARQRGRVPECGRP